MQIPFNSALLNLALRIDFCLYKFGTITHPSRIVCLHIQPL